MKRMTRRQTTGLIFAGSLMPYAALAQSTSTEGLVPDLPELLGLVLNEKLGPECDGTFTVLNFEQGRISGYPAMASVIQLDWPPGFRRRLIRSGGRTVEDAFRALIHNSTRSFAPKSTSCVS